MSTPGEFGGMYPQMYPGEMNDPLGPVRLPERSLHRRPWFVRLLALALLVGIWQWTSLLNDRVPDVGDIVSFFITEVSGSSHGGTLTGEFWGPLLLSLGRYGVGLAIGLPAGIILGLAVGSSGYCRGMLYDTLVVLLALPAVVWAFLASLWFGFGNVGPVLAVVLTAAPFVAIHLGAGVRNIDAGLVRMSRAYRVPLERRIAHLLLGGALPSVFSGCRLAFIAGWNSLLIVEWFGATAGVGWRARFWYDALRFDGFAGWILLFVVLIGLLDRVLLGPLERRSFQWSQQPTMTFSEDM